MRVRLLKSIVVPGFPGVVAGTVLEVPDRLASVLLGRGHAEIAEKAPTTSREAIETRDPEVEARDPQAKSPKAVPRVKPGPPA
jgi:hypothetical protein